MKNDIISKAFAVKAKAAYEHWEKNPHLQTQELCIAKGVNRKGLTAWMRMNNKGRPDGRVIGKGSPRQQAIKEAYEKALQGGFTINWAKDYALNNGASSIGLGDIRYYGMRNDLPDLPEAALNNPYQESPHKVKL